MKTTNYLLLVTATVILAFAGLTSCETYDYDREVVTYSVGDRVDTLPARYRTVYIDGKTYYYARGNYYTTRGNSYYVVDRPLRRASTTATVGTRYDRLPSRYRTVRYGNRDYYYANGTYYRPRGSAYISVRDPFSRW